MTAPTARPACTECMDAGYRMVDGRPSGCPAGCRAGQDWAEKFAGGQRYPTPNNMAPGAEVLARRDAAEAAGVPPGTIGGDVPVRAMLVRDEVLVAALGHLVYLLDAKDFPSAARDARAFLDRLPDDYRSTLPTIPEGQRRSRRDRRGGGTPRKQGGPAAAVPLEPPGRSQ